MMRVRLTFAEELHEALRRHLLQGDLEEVALLFAHESQNADHIGLIVSRWEAVPPDAFLQQGADIFSVDPGLVARCVKQAKLRGESVLLAHCHPGDQGIPKFSLADEHGERGLYQLLGARIPDRVHGAFLVSPGGEAARFRLPTGEVRDVDEIHVVGRRLQRSFTRSSADGDEADEAHARQRLIWGSHGQGLLRNATVGIIGAGGTGSVVAQQLIHLGVGTLIVVDNQLVAESNLSRIPGARIADIDRTRKVDVIARTAALVDPNVKVVPLFGNVADPAVLTRFKSVDLLFVCTDSFQSRAVVNAFAAQYVIPMIDLAFLIDVHEPSKRLIAAFGEIRIVVPGGYCLSCAGVLKAEQIMAERATPAQRAAHPGYYAHVDVEDPSVITLNSTIASLAVTLGCDMLVPAMRPVDRLDGYRYNAVKGLVSYDPKVGNPQCGICGAEGRKATGDSLPLPS